DFKTRFFPQTEISAEQAFWYRYSVQSEEPNISACTTTVEVPKELPKVSMIEEDADEEEEDLEEDPKEDPEEDWKEDPKENSERDDDDVMEMDNEAEVIDHYMDDGSNNPPPPNSEDEEIPHTSPIIPDVDGQPIPPIASFGQNFHFGESSSTANLLTGNSKIVPTGPMCCDNIEMDRTVRNVRSDLSGLKKEPPADPSARPVPASYPDDPYVVTRGAAIAASAIATFGIDDDDDTAPMDSHPYEPPNRAEGPNVAPVPWDCTFANFMKCSPITFLGNEGAVGLIRWIEKTKMVFTVSKCNEANKVVFAAATFQDRALTWVKEMDISSYTTRFNKLVILRPGIVPTERKKVEAYIRGLLENIKGEVTSSEPATLNKALRMAHTLMEQKVKAIAKREADNKKRKLENFQGGSSSGVEITINLGPNVVTGTFLLNNYYARVLFDSGSNKSFVSVNFSHLIDIEPVKVDHSYEVELADGRVVSTNTILRGCALNLVNHMFEIDLMPIELGTFDEVHVPLKKRTLVVKGDDCVSRLNVVSCIKVKKYMDRGSYLFVAQVIEKEPIERCLEDVPVIYKFPNVFPEDFPGLPPPRQVEFEIELVPGAAPVARAPYRLAPS
nr:putative reverse transcriptase domain-containing protein [Tanacetum cinerariifolium]